MEKIKITIVPVDHDSDVSARILPDVQGDVVASLADLFRITATLTRDSTIHVKAEVVEEVQRFLRVDVESMWVQYGVDSSFFILTNQEWIIL